MQYRYILLIIATFTAALIDGKTLKIPNILVFTTFVLTFLCMIIFELSYLLESFISALVLASFMILFRVVMKKGFGLGDIKLLTVIAFNIGIVKSWVLLLSASLLGILWFLIKTYFIQHSTIKSKQTERFAFAPFIFLGLLVAIFTNISF